MKSLWCQTCFTFLEHWKFSFLYVRHFWLIFFYLFSLCTINISQQNLTPSLTQTSAQTGIVVNHTINPLTPFSSTTKKKASCTSSGLPQHLLHPQFENTCTCPYYTHILTHFFIYIYAYIWIHVYLFAEYSYMYMCLWNNPCMCILLHTFRWLWQDAKHYTLHCWFLTSSMAHFSQCVLRGWFFL